ncbi:MAG: CBU_0592 family membrane protein [Thermoplasmatota archaeon]
MAFGVVDAVGTIGLLSLLGGFVGSTFGKIASTSRLYHVLNLVGSGILAWYAAAIHAWIFLPLEVIWALVAIWGLVRPSRVRPQPS